MVGKTIDYEMTEHARESLRRRPDIRLEWLERALQQPMRVQSDAIDPDLEHRLLRIDEHEGRVLHVIVNRTTRSIRVITAYFDRNMRSKL